LTSEEEVALRSGKIIHEAHEIKKILQNTKTIAVVGLSPKPEKDSHAVSAYLKKQGYRIVPIHPSKKEILGEKVYASLDDVKEPVDVVDVFRRSDQVLAHAREALRLRPKVFWMQINVENQEAAELLTEAGIDVVMNQCMMAQHKKLLG
jgi:predicted CoA-binding protein